MICGAVHCRLKALGLHIFVRGFGRAYKLNGGAIIISQGDYNGNGKSCSKQANAVLI